VALLDPHLDGDQGAQASWGACQLHGAITAARIGREGDALRGIDQAMTMARALPEASAHLWTLFGVANTEICAVSVQVDLRKSGGALDVASAVDPDAVPSVDRRSRLWLELSRAYALQRDWLGSLGALRTGAAISEESMRSHPPARSLASDLVTHGGRLNDRESQALATRLGVTA